jgi:hypothetical protein
MRSYPNPPLGFDSVHNPILACDSTEMLIGNRTSAYYRGRSALDSAGGLDPSGALPAPQMRPDRAEAIGQARASTDQSEPQALSKEHAASLIDLAHRAGANQTDLDGFGRVLSLLATGGEHGAPAAQDRNTGGGRKISRDTAIKAWKLAKDKLSPQDLAQLVKMLDDMVDPDMVDTPAQGQAVDQPPAFPGRPTPGGALVGDQALDFERRFPGVLRLARSDDHYAEPCPRRPSPSPRQQQLALDSANRAGSGSSLQRRDPQLYADLMRIGRAY